MKRAVFLPIIVSIVLVVSKALSSPPIPPVLSMQKQKISKKKIPKECKLLPPMIVFLPPPVEKELNECKNKLFKPEKDFAQKRLSKIFKKKIIVKAITILKKFSRLYRIRYNNNKIVLCNDKISACIEQ